MAINRKGVVFSLVAIFLSVLFILLFSAYTHVPLDADSKINQYGINKAENFFHSFPSYYGTAVEISSYDVLKYMINKSPIPEGNFSSMFEECLLTGRNEYYNESCSLNSSLNITLENNLNIISDMASNIYRGSCNVFVLNVSVSQDSLYKLNVHSKIKVMFTKNDFITWEIIYEVDDKVDFTGLNHPLTKKYGHYMPIKYLDEYFMKQSFAGKGSLITTYVKEGYSYGDPSAPSFIDAIENRTLPGTYNASLPFGINFFIPNQFPDGNYTYIENRSMIALDYVNDKYVNKSDLRLVGRETSSYNYPPFLKYSNLTFDVDDLRLMNFTSNNMLSADTDCGCDSNGCYCP